MPPCARDGYGVDFLNLERMKISEVKITDIIQDDKNLNKGTADGKAMITKSLQKFGAGRSILLDKNNRIIAGNKTHENAEEIGMEDVIVVESDGSKLVAVKRTDIDLDSKEGREMALADNATVKVDLSWDDDAMRGVSETWGIDTEEWGVELDEKKATELLSELEFTDTYYEPDEKPNLRLKDCIDTELFDKKMQFVESLDLPDEMKETLRILAYRFIQIDFENVANYYAFNATEEEKKAIERLRLVLVDGGLDGFIEDDLLKVLQDD